MERGLTRAAPVVVLALTACAGARPAADASAEPAAVIPDVAITDDRGQVVTIRDGRLAERYTGIVGMDGETGIAVENRALVWRDLESGEVISRVGLTSDLVPAVTDVNGRLVALTTPIGPKATRTIAPGRTTTAVTVVAPDGEQWTRRLDGNYVPEGFSWEANGSAPWLYVLEYLPAEAPTHYRVRLLDLGTGQLSLPYSLRKYGATVDTQMAGISRDQVVATGRGILFTLYRGHHADEGTDYAFVHVLAMGGGVWCLGVPADLALDQRQGAVAVSPDEETLYVAGAGGVAEYDIDAVLDPQRDPVATRTARVPSTHRGTPVLAADADGPVVALGSGVLWLGADLGVEAKDGADTAIDAVAALGAKRAIVATGDRLAVLGPEGEGVSFTLPDDVGRVTQIVPD